MSQEQRKQQMQQGSVREIRRELRMLEFMRCVEGARHAVLQCAEAGCRIGDAHGDSDARPGAASDGDSDGDSGIDADRDTTAQESAAWAQQRRKRMVSALLVALHDNVTTTAELLKLEEQTRTSRLGDGDADDGPRRTMTQLAAKAAQQRPYSWYCSPRTHARGQHIAHGQNEQG